MKFVQGLSSQRTFDWPEIYNVPHSWYNDNARWSWGSRSRADWFLPHEREASLLTSMINTSCIYLFVIGVKKKVWILNDKHWTQSQELQKRGACINGFLFLIKLVLWELLPYSLILFSIEGIRLIERKG